MYNYSNLYLDIIGCLTIASMTPTMIFRMLSLPTVFDLHDGSTISTLSMVDYMLDPAIRKSHSVLSLHAATLITRPLLTEVCVIFVIMHSIFKVEGIRLLIIMISTSMATMSNNSLRGRKAEHMDR